MEKHPRARVYGRYTELVNGALWGPKTVGAHWAHHSKLIAGGHKPWPLSE